MKPRVSIPALVYLLVLGLTLGLYSISLHGPFVYDDIEQIYNNRRLHDIFNLKDVIFCGLRQYRVALNISYAIDWTISHGQSWSFHLTNLALHLLTGYLFHGYLRKILPDRPRLAAIAGALFLLHPLQTSSVSYIMGRNTVAQAVLYLACLNLAASPSRHKPRSIALIGLLTAVSVLVKETGVLIPIALLLHQWIFDRRIHWQTLAASIVGSFALLPVWLLFRSTYNGYEGAHGFTLFPFWEYAATQAYYWLYHSYLFLNPAYQSLIHPYPTFTAKILWLAILSTLIFAGVLLTSLHPTTRKRFPAVSFFILFYFLLMAPTNSPLQLINPFAEYRLYAPDLVLCFFMALGLDTLLSARKLRFVGTAVGSLVAMYFLYASYQQQLAWTDDRLLAAASLEVYPSSAELNCMMGGAFADRKLYEAASEYYLKADALSANWRETIRTRILLTDLYLRMGRDSEALALVEKLRMDNPGRRFSPDYYREALYLYRKFGKESDYQTAFAEARTLLGTAAQELEPRRLNASPATLNEPESGSSASTRE